MSEEKPPFDEPRAHKMLAAICFNKAWDYMEKPARTPEENEAMVLASSASLWHWMQRDDCENVNLAIGHWQLSRVLSLARRGNEAAHHAARSLHFSQGLTPFYIGYAHEAAARAALLTGKRDEFFRHLMEARTNAESAKESEQREELLHDIAELEAAS